jgi:hypothetical protein
MYGVVGLFKVLCRYLIDLSEYGLRLFDSVLIGQIENMFYESGADRTLLGKRKRAERLPEGLAVGNLGHIIAPLITRNCEFMFR